MAASKELYNILGVDSAATDAEIRSAYERLIAANPEGTPQYESIVRAYTILSDMDSRAAYDITGKVKNAPKRRRSTAGNGIDKARYTLNTLFLAGAAVTTILFVLQLSGTLTTMPFYWACGASLLIKIAEYILRLIP